ncbi:probable WRKY transcription factor 14 isoform X2 [Typha latifolia]|uniref:probable WRKY transcription factor 14 isoform X2 n=1 Tax=Typha latifolia TaxID=4733 RepID=UPI003C2CD580
MCDFFWQRMENDQGDLADIVRAGGRGGATPRADLPTPDWRLPVEPVIFPASSSADVGPAGDFGDPFANLRDPLLNELSGMESLDAAVSASEGREGGGGLLAQKIQVGEEMSNNIFSRVLQISPAGVKPSLLLPTPPPMVAGGMLKVGGGSEVDTVVGVQISSPRTPGIKRRKSQAKKVVCIPAPAVASGRSSGEVVPSDLWAWRKYGQKPIKGSPYPRGYYRCSSSKGCSARKQVERSRTDPNMLVITYTSEHNHPWPTQRNALAGSTRSQPSKSSSSASKISPHYQKPPQGLKEEAKETTRSSNAPLVKEEVGEMKSADASEDNELNQVLHQSYNPMIPESNQPDDFFADLTELETDPMSLIFSKEFMEAKPDEERGDKGLDPFNMFDWGGSSFGEAKKG